MEKSVSLNGNGDGLPSKTIWEHIKHSGPKLVPFFKTLALYFFFFVPVEQPSIFAMILKCLPILGLGVFVCLHGRGISGSERHTFSRRILVGLAFSCLGDAFLIWPVYFPHGIAAFGVAQIFYCWAYGFKHPHWNVGGILYAINAVGLAVIVPNMKDVPTPVIIGLPVYSMLLMTTVWRGIARVESMEKWTCSQMFSSVGGIVFAISDSLIGITQFFMPIPSAQFLIMSTYYFAQLCISLAIVTVNGELASSEGEQDKESKTLSEALQFDSVDNGNESRISTKSSESTANEVKSGQVLVSKSSPILSFDKSLL